MVSVDLSKAVNIEEIPPYTFSGCSALEQIVIPSQIKKIGYGAFSNCTSLKADKVTMSENLQSMAGSVFSGCTSFTELPDLKSMTSIPEYTFSYCTGLVKVEVPDQIQTIGGQAFYNCTNLVAIDLEPALMEQNWKHGILTSSMKCTIHRRFIRQQKSRKTG